MTLPGSTPRRKDVPASPAALVTRERTTSIDRLVLLPDGRVLAGGQVWDAKSGLRQAQLAMAEHAGFGRIIGRCDRGLVTLADQLLAVWELDRGKPVHRFHADGLRDATAAVSSDGRSVFVSGFGLFALASLTALHRRRFRRHRERRRRRVLVGAAHGRLPRALASRRATHRLRRIAAPTNRLRRRRPARRFFGFAAQVIVLL